MVIGSELLAKLIVFRAVNRNEGAYNLFLNDIIFCDALELYYQHVVVQEGTDIACEPID
jgi:hypothetical protein